MSELGFTLHIVRRHDTIFTPRTLGASNIESTDRGRRGDD